MKAIYTTPQVKAMILMEESELLAGTQINLNINGAMVSASSDDDPADSRFAQSKGTSVWEEDAE